MLAPMVEWLSMEIEFDTDGDRINRARHGLPLSAVAAPLGGRSHRAVNDRLDRGEQRLPAFGWSGRTVHACIDTLVGAVTRVIWNSIRSITISFAEIALPTAPRHILKQVSIPEAQLYGS